MKHCSGCGHANSDDAVFCGGCGAPMSQPHEQQSPAAPAQQNDFRYNTDPTGAYNTTGSIGYSLQDPGSAYATAQDSPPVKNGGTLWLVLNIVSLVVCCPGSFVFNVIGLILAAMGNAGYKRGDYSGSISKNRAAMVMFILGLGFGVIGFIIIGILGYYRVFS